jgi:ferredoxin
MLRITIHRDKCVGSGNCAFWAPATFDLDDEGISVVLDPVGDTEDRIRVAAEGCPSKAITVEDDGTDAGAPAEPTREGHDADRAVR